MLENIAVQSGNDQPISIFMEEPNDTPRSAGCCDWRKTVDDLSDRTQKFVREDPAKAVSLALLGGVLLTIFPVGRVLGALVRLAVALARPLLLVLGAVKLYEEFEKKQKR
jgi:hypothetical protein